jgi:hypothetical protein
MMARRFHPCLCCGSRTIANRGDYEVCGICGWEDDPAQAKDPDFRGGANKPSLNQARAAWLTRKDSP